MARLYRALNRLFGVERGINNLDFISASNEQIPSIRQNPPNIRSQTVDWVMHYRMRMRVYSEYEEFFFNLLIFVDRIASV